MLWEEFDRPGALQAFRVIRPDELRLEHWFELESVGGATVLRHVVEGYPTGKGRAIWKRMEPRHDLAVEAILDNVEAAISRPDGNKRAAEAAEPQADSVETV